MVFTFPTIVGLSLFLGVENLDRRFGKDETVDRSKVWRLRSGSPFPDELQIVLNGSHAGIKPSGTEVTKEKLKEVN